MSYKKELESTDQKKKAHPQKLIKFELQSASRFKSLSDDEKANEDLEDEHNADNVEDNLQVSSCIK